LSKAKALSNRDFLGKISFFTDDVLFDFSTWSSDVDAIQDRINNHTSTGICLSDVLPTNAIDDAYNIIKKEGFSQIDVFRYLLGLKKLILAMRTPLSGNESIVSIAPEFLNLADDTFDIVNRAIDKIKDDPNINCISDATITADKAATTRVVVLTFALDKWYKYNSKE